MPTKPRGIIIIAIIGEASLMLKKCLLINSMSKKKMPDIVTPITVEKKYVFQKPAELKFIYHGPISAHTETIVAGMNVLPDSSFIVFK